MPNTIGIMFLSMIASLAVVMVGHLGVRDWLVDVRGLVREIDFDQALMDGMLSFLLFAGALHVKLEELARYRFLVTFLASVGVVFTTFAVGTIAWLIFGALGMELPFIYGLLFGALIAPIWCRARRSVGWRRSRARAASGRAPPRRSLPRWRPAPSAPLR